MTTEQIFHIQTSFAAVAPQADTAAALFYARLFTLDPTLRALFPEDLQEQGRKLMSTLAVVVRGLNRLEELLPTVQRLGERHHAYGVQEAHYATVGEALLWTLEQALSERFTAEVRAAWAAAYTLLADVMCTAAAALQGPALNTVLPRAS